MQRESAVHESDGIKNKSQPATGRWIEKLIAMEEMLSVGRGEHPWTAARCAGSVQAYVYWGTLGTYEQYQQYQRLGKGRS